MVAFENLTSIKKFIFQNEVVLDLFPNVQELLYAFRQIDLHSPEAGGILLGYENTNTRSFTVSNATKPQPTDIRSRIAIQLNRAHYETTKKLELPYGYIGTWHTHPSQVPTPSAVDLHDWEKCIQKNRNATSALVFIIAGTETFRIWICDSATGHFYEGIML